MRASWCGAPDAPWRITIMSGDIASSVLAVSASVSPLTTLEPEVVMPSVSALSRFSASSNDMRVRVLGSKNRLMTVRPRMRRHFLDRARADFLHRERGLQDQIDLGRLEVGDAEQVPAAERRGGAHPSTSTSSRPSISVQAHLHALLTRRRDVAPDVVGANRQLAMAAIDERDELNRARAAEVDERVERGANRPPRVQHVIHEQNQPAVDRERNLRPADDRLRSDGVPHEVVAVERDVQRAGRHVDAGELASCAASRAASGTPRARMPTSARSSAPRLRSRISCAMRVRLRDTRSASITTAMANPDDAEYGAEWE